MILQIVYVNDKEEVIQLSDGLNTCFLNFGRYTQTREALCKKINRKAGSTDLYKSIYVFSNFTFEVDWDYENKRLMVALDTDDFGFLYPGCIHEKVFRSKDLTSVLGNIQRESLKRAAMMKKLQAPDCSIDVGELIGTTSSGGLVIDEEILAASAKPVVHRHGPDGTTSRLGDEAAAPVIKTLMKDGWLTFPKLESESVPLAGGVFDSLEEFLNQGSF